MKKLTLFLIILPFTILSCYIFDYSGNSRIALRIASFPSGVKAVHLAGYDGFPSADNILMTTVLTSGKYTEIEVPAGDNRYFVFVGESNDGFATYHGISGPYNISEGAIANIVVSMDYIVDLSRLPSFDMFNLDCNSDTCILSWDAIPGASGYLLNHGFINNQQEVEYDYVIPTSLTQFNPIPFDYYRVAANFEQFNLYSYFGLGIRALCR